MILPASQKQKIDGFSTQLINCELPMGGDVQVAVKLFSYFVKQYQSNIS